MTKAARTERSHARKIAVWGSMPRKERRPQQTAGTRLLNRVYKAGVRKGKTGFNTATQLPNATSGYLDAIGVVPEPTPRQLAARKAAATRKANRATKP